VVGFTALTSARLVFPRFEKLPFAVSLPLQVLTLISGSVFGSAAALYWQPLYSVQRYKTVAVAVLINAVIAVIVGISLHTYDRMRRQIVESYEVLRRKEALEREIEIARDVQRQLLPRALPEVHGLELAAVCRPAVGVGGDFYDFLTHADDRLGIVVADVSGKGIPAALLMAGLQASVRSIAHPGAMPADVNRRLNDSVHRSTDDARYATVFLALWDGRAMALDYSNAGHYPPILLRGREVERLTASGLPIGALPGSIYREGRCRLAAGDLLAMYTDGIVEAPGPTGEEFGEQRLAAILRDKRGEPLDEVLAAVLRAVGAWTNGSPPHDDATLVLARAR
jgi:sigma-B regulation protein RsbU (phosphoserine phosphatase)